jgi:NAD(P)-dependent dehydrogenase (short-subunit alcohol dehydrogenase family)
MLLEGKNAVIYGAGGSVGGAVAATFAREGAPRVPHRPDPRRARRGR